MLPEVTLYLGIYSVHGDSKQLKLLDQCLLSHSNIYTVKLTVIRVLQFTEPYGSIMYSKGVRTFLYPDDQFLGVGRMELLGESYNRIDRYER